MNRLMRCNLATVLASTVGFAASLTPADAQVSRLPPPTLSWISGATCYEVFVRSFADSDGDGVGDLRGLTARLDYINDGDPHSERDLGARCIWLMPVAESPSYHGYDVTDYYRVDPEYGTNDDFRAFVAAAHRRGIRVLVDMVVNHTSSEHPYFRAALRDTASEYRSWYRFAPVPGPKNRWGGDNWHKSPLRDEYYYGFFWSGMPDLNFEAPGPLAEMKKIATYWLTEMGVDGFRLDAIRHLLEQGEVTENVAGTHDVLRDYAAHVRAVKPSAYTVGEVWEPIETMLAYYPDQLDSHFAFEVADSIVSAVGTGSARGLFAPILTLQQALPAYRYAPFLRNHDQPRTRTELGGDPGRSRVASFLLLTLPGVPFVYYGEEIGMIGSKPDERLRTPMQWTTAPGAGFTQGTPWQQLQDDSATTTVESQEADPRSLLNLHRRLIHLRADHPALADGDLIPLATSNDAVAAYLRRAGERTVLVVANLSGEAAHAVQLTSPRSVLPEGQWLMRSLFGGASAAPLLVQEGGRFEEYVPLGSLAPYEGYLFEVESGRVLKR
jgi:alpha-amylase